MANGTGTKRQITADGVWPEGGRRGEDYQYDVCLSFAGEDRLYVEKVADALRKLGVRVFYDRYEQVKLWGRDLYTHLIDVYSTAARYCVLFASRFYADKVWTNHERAAAQERAITEHREYILPARFDNTKIPGIHGTVAYLNLKAIKPRDLARMIKEKLGVERRSNFLPPMPDLLFRSYANDYGEADPVVLSEKAAHFMDALRRTRMDEREAIIQLFSNTCPADLPRNVHMNIDLLSRLTEMSESKLLRLFQGLRSLGFYTRSFTRDKDEGPLGEDRIISVEWHDMSVEPGNEMNSTDVAHQMLNITDFAHCENCSLTALRRLDFSHLSSATLNQEAHDLVTGRTIPNLGRELRKLHPIRVTTKKKRNS